MLIRTKLLLAAITEGIVLLIVTFVVIMLFIRYIQRKKSTALALAVAFGFWDIAILCLFIFRIFAYLQEIAYINYGIGFSEIGINLGYGFSALSNVFILVFVALVFSQSPMFRRTGMLVPIIFAALNGITIGLLIGTTITYWPYPEYALFPTIYHLLLTLTSFSALIYFTIKPYRDAKLKWEQAGFQFIITSGVFGILVYLSFVLDLVFGDLLGIFQGGYTPFFFFAYLCAALMCIFAYLGYTMPNYIRKIFK